MPKLHGGLRDKTEFALGHGHSEQQNIFLQGPFLNSEIKNV